MAAMIPYTVGYNFTGFQNNSPTTPLPAPKLDIELQNISYSINSLIKAIDQTRKTTLANVTVISPQDFGGLQQALDARRNVTGLAGSSYSGTGFELGNSESFDGNGTLFTGTAGTHTFTLRGFNPVLERVYSPQNLGSGALVRINSDTESTRFTRVSDVTAVNSGAGVVLIDDNGADPDDVGITTLRNVYGAQVTGTGFDIRSGVSIIKGSHLFAIGQIDYVGGLGKPRAGSIGWRQNTPVVGGIAVGGHKIIGLHAEALEKGVWLTDAQLTTLAELWADGCSDYGLIIDGASDHVDINGAFVGTTRGVFIGGSAGNVVLRDLTTILTGVIPPWGQPGFFNGVSTFFDVTVAGTAKVTIEGDSWRGGKRVSVAPTAQLIVTGGRRFSGRSTAIVPAASAVFLSESGSATTIESEHLWRAPHDGWLFGLQAQCVAAPGAGQSYTYTVRKSFSDTALTAQITDGGFIGLGYGPVSIQRGESISIRLNTSAGAAATRHQVELQMLGL